MNNIDIFEESPNGFHVVAATTLGLDESIRYYLDELETFDVKKNPLEFGIIHSSMGKLLFGDKSKLNNNDERAKQVENALFYFNNSLEVFTTDEYPIMFAVVSVFMAKLFRERSSLISARNFLGERSTQDETLQYGVDQALEALGIFMNSRTHKVEYAVCCAELGYLHLLQSELPKYAEDNFLREQALAYLDRAIGLSESLPEVVLTMIDNDNPVRWQPNDPVTFPHHIRLLLEEQPFTFLEGVSYYLMGRLEQGWGFFGTDDHDHCNNVRADLPNLHVQQSYDYYCKSVGARCLSITSHFWGDAHHRIALLTVRFPSLVDPDYGKNPDMQYSEVNLDSAISHISLALRCKQIGRHDRMDQEFHLAQTYIAKLQRIIDQVPFGESVTKAIIAVDGIDLIKNIELHLGEALKRVTAANTQSVQDGYLFYFASLKLAEFRMLEAACVPNLELSEREEFLKESVKFLIDACVSRTIADNTDMHYIASSQLAQVIMAAKRTHAAARAYSKLFFVLAALINRWMFNTKVVEKKMIEDNNRHLTSSIFAAAKGTKWLKLHIGPMKLHERPAAGFATWSFEDCPRKKHSSASMVASIKDSVTCNNSIAAENEHESSQQYWKPPKALLPKTIPPLNLLHTKKVYVAGDDIENTAVTTVDPDENQTIASTTSAFKPPTGAVPLSAMGQSPVDDSSIVDDCSLSEDVQFTPYAGRMRSKVPPIKEMKEIDKSNRLSYGLAGGKVAYLLPVYNSKSKATQRNSDDYKKNGMCTFYLFC
jgi:hypothetical protein